jgi:hypothetical protein
VINFAYTNRVDTATITASSEVATLPAANVKQPWKTKVWRTTGDTSEWIKFNFGSAQTVRALVVVGHNLTSGATIKIQGNATDVWTAPSVDVTLTWNAANLVYLWGSDQSYQYWRITLADAANPSGYLEIGRVFLGPTTTPDRNFSSWAREVVDPTTITPSYDGAESFEQRTAYDLLSFDFLRVLPATFDTLIKAVGQKEYFFIIADYDNVLLTDGRHDLTRYCRFEELPAFTYSFMTRHDITLTVREAL